MRPWCRPYQALLVNDADGVLDAAGQQRLARHLARCRHCTAAAAALRELPAALRADAVPDPGEAFWRQQRQSISRALRSVPAPQPAGWRAAVRRAAGGVQSAHSALRWRYPLALAASAAVAVLVYRIAVQTPAAPPAGTPSQLAALDSQAVLAVHELMQTLVPVDEYVPEPSADDESELAALPLGDLVGVRATAELPALSDFDDTELDGLGTLIGAGQLTDATS